MKSRILLLFVIVFFVKTVIAQSISNKSRPNIIFIYTDDQAYWTLGVSGNRQSYTPNLDRLAKQGAFFQNSLVTTPVCSPARASLMTSQYASEYGITDFIPQPGHKLYDPGNPIGLDPSSITFAEVLQHEGYKNGLIGKWHLGDWTETEDRKFSPVNHGFDYFMGITGGGMSPSDPYLEKDGIVKKFKGLTIDILTDDALEFVESYQGQPFLLCVNYRSPHAAWLPVAEEDWTPYENLDINIPNPDYLDLDIDRVKKRMKEYMASVSGVDRSVGKIMKKLTEIGLDSNTIVIFSSDNGYNMGHNGIEHKGNGIWITKETHPATRNIAENSRPNLYDNSLRVPAIIRWPGVIKPNTIVKEVVSNLDWYPTILEMAKAKLPDNKIIRGRSLMSLLNGKPPSSWNNDFYGEYNMINYSKANMRCFRTPKWKLIKDFADPTRDELYNLEADPEESTNLIGRNTEEIKDITKTLTLAIIQKMKEIGDTTLVKETSF